MAAVRICDSRSPRVRCRLESQTGFRWVEILASDDGVHFRTIAVMPGPAGIPRRGDPDVCVSRGDGEVLSHRVGWRGSVCLRR